MFRSVLSQSRPLVNKFARHMSTMKAVVVERIGGPEVLEYKDHPKPQVSSGKILVKNHAIGMQRGFTLFAQFLDRTNRLLLLILLC